MAKKKVQEPDVVEADSPELAVALADGTAIGSFVGGLRVFFHEAQLLDMNAQQTLARMEGLRLPTNAAEDEQVTSLVRAINQQKKAVDKHWHVTQLFSRMHKWAVARRERAGKALDQAALIGNRLHQTYKDAEIRRAREEQARQQRENEERARADQERQAAELEAAVLKMEATSPVLSERERQFVDFYTLDIYAASSKGNGVTAARRAGFKNPDQTAVRLLQTPKIQKAIKAVEDATALRRQATAIREAPVEVEDVVVRPDVNPGGDVTTWSWEMTDPIAFRDAVFEGKHGIPRDTLVPDQKTLNQYARDMKHLMDRWPGGRAKKTTSVR